MYATYVQVKREYIRVIAHYNLATLRQWEWTYAKRLLQLNIYAIKQ